MNEKLPARLRAWSNDIMERTKIIGCDQDLRDAATELEQARHVLKLALEYWAHRQQRYKNKNPVWVQAAKDLGL